MGISVTAVVVATHNSAWLAETLAALDAQALKPARTVIVSMRGALDGQLASIAAASGCSAVTSSRTLPFGEAIDLALVGLSALADDEWLWFLPHDAAPEPDTLAKLVATVQRAPSVAVAGPKLVDTDDPRQILEIGQTLTQRGQRWQLSRPELDQQQYDNVEDVLAVGAPGMLVRRSVWQQLDGFDPALPVYDDALDFCVRARLAGHRVVVSAGTRLRFGGDGIAGPRISRRRSVARSNYRLERAAYLHRRITYAKPLAAFFMWLGLPIFGVISMVWALIREQPGRIGAEFLAAMQTFFAPGRITRARRELKRINTVGWESVDPLRVDKKTVHTVRMIDREAILVKQGRGPVDRHFITAGGLAVLLGATVFSLLMFWWMFGASFLSGGTMLALSPSIGELWANTQFTNGLPADPFTWVLAALGTVTFFNPSLAIVLLVLFTIPLAALGAWMWASEITEKPAGRALAAAIWALSPVLFTALSEGRLATLIAAAALPWLLLAGTRAAKSWGRAAVTSLLAAVVLAAAPSLIPAAIVFFVIAFVMAGSGSARLLLVPVAPLALFAPVIVHAVLTLSPLTIFIDPGVLTEYGPAGSLSTAAGFGVQGLGGWPDVFTALGLTVIPEIVLVGILLAPVAALALLGLYVSPIKRTLSGVLLAGVGLLSALLAPNLLFASVGSEPVALYSGSGLLLYWLGLATLAASGVAALGKLAPTLTAVTATAALVAVAPMVVAIASNTSAIVPNQHRLPALVRADAQINPGVGTIVLTAQPDGEAAIASTLDRGAGLTLDQLRTARFAGPLREDEIELAGLTAALVSTGASETLSELSAAGVEFVVVTPPQHETQATSPSRLNVLGTLDANAALTSIGTTESGDLWRLNTPAELTAAASPNPSWFEQLVWVAQLFVLIVVVLLALPTAEVVDRPVKKPRVGSKKWQELHHG